MHIAFWFKIYLITKLFSYYSIFVGIFSGLGGDFCFNYIFPMRYIVHEKHRLIINKTNVLE